ncbi:hypothetical protein GCM10010923_00870 [Blastomonas marina]|uniref:DUF1449 domain-containing protein n=1 Tax=Blastomonas marina TaxID=1867408 RepID=A0ABQ1F1B4_9SPHN|nr:OB-fold-containig protein [Blastomonas marina]GFZ96855.1 hypothetical protein GCM10010923_00870 [Blastomonas marina]
MTLFEPHNLPFAAALGLMLALALAQAVGLGDALGAEAEIDLDADLDGDAAISAGPLDGLFTLLGIGRVPFTIWLATFLFAFAALGLGIQQLAAGLTGAPLYSWLAALFAGGAALPVTGVVARPLGAIIPQDESTAVSTQSLVGRRATITDGTARAASPARARVKDVHGQQHHVMVEPHETSSEFLSGDEVLLVRCDGNIFFATALSERRLSPTD